MDIEWAKDGENGEIYIVQARPETVKSRANNDIVRRFRITQKGRALAEGRAIGQKIGIGRAHFISGAEDMHELKAGEVLVADMTDPDWEPIMKRAAAIVTRRGGGAPVTPRLSPGSWASGHCRLRRQHWRRYKK